MDALDIIRKHAGEADIDFLRETLQVVLYAVMDADVSQQIGAGLHEHTPDRSAYRNGYRPRRWDTRAGTIDLRIPKLRAGTYLPPFLEPRRVEGLVQALGCDGRASPVMSRTTKTKTCKLPSDETGPCFRPVCDRGEQQESPSEQGRQSTPSDPRAEALPDHAATQSAAG